MKNISLFYQEGSSDKVYNVSLQQDGAGYVVNFSYGRRGAALSNGTKTTQPVDLSSAQKIFDKLVKEKKAKGYIEDGDSQSSVISVTDKTDSGYRCQLLSDIGEEEAVRLIHDDLVLMEEKHDGRRLMIKCKNSQLTGINKKGLVVALPVAFEKIAELGKDFLIDTEDMGSYVVAFDILEIDGVDLTKRTLQERKEVLHKLLEEHLLPTRLVRKSTVYLSTESKARALETLSEYGAEGVVFKLKSAPYTSGKPSSGGSQYKFKFYATASFIVSKVNTQRSVAISLFKDGAEISAGNVTIPPNLEVPQVGDIIEVRYLYAFKESGSVYQPVYLCKRDDVDREECTIEQIKWKVMNQD